MGSRERRGAELENDLVFHQEEMDCGLRIGVAAEFKIGGERFRQAVSAPADLFDRSLAEASLIEWARSCGWNG